MGFIRWWRSKKILIPPLKKFINLACPSKKVMRNEIHIEVVIRDFTNPIFFFFKLGTCPPRDTDTT